jgi:hypothetical protein
MPASAPLLVPAVPAVPPPLLLSLLQPNSLSISNAVLVVRMRVVLTTERRAIIPAI